MLCWTAKRVINTAFTFYLTKSQLILYIDDHIVRYFLKCLLCLVPRLPQPLLEPSPSSQQVASESSGDLLVGDHMGEGWRQGRGL